MVYGFKPQRASEAIPTRDIFKKTCPTIWFQTPTGFRGHPNPFVFSRIQYHYDVSNPNGLQRPSQPIRCKIYHLANSSFKPQRASEAIPTLNVQQPSLSKNWFQTPTGFRGHPNLPEGQLLVLDTWRFKPQRASEAIPTPFFQW